MHCQAGAVRSSDNMNCSTFPWKEQASLTCLHSGKMENDAHARALGSILVQHAIEENKQNGRAVARLCAALLECPSGAAFHVGVVTSVSQYFECREQLRAGHLRLWIAFLSFVSDLYANIGFTYEGGLVGSLCPVKSGRFRRTCGSDLRRFPVLATEAGARNA